MGIVSEGEGLSGATMPAHGASAASTQSGPGYARLNSRPRRSDQADFVRFSGKAEFSGAME
jgi:hypothetical protein